MALILSDIADFICCFICDNTIEYNIDVITLCRPVYPEEEEEMDDNVIDDEAELDLNKVEEEMADDIEDDEFGEEESLLDLNALKSQKVAKIVEILVLPFVY